jgi:hypothetical protein
MIRLTILEGEASAAQNQCPWDIVPSERSDAEVILQEVMTRQETIKAIMRFSE